MTEMLMQELQTQEYELSIRDIMDELLTSSVVMQAKNIQNRKRI